MGPVDPELYPSDVRRPRLAVALSVVAAGGIVGSVARLAIGALSSAPRGSLPWATLFVNLTGSFAIGALVVVLAARSSASALPRLFLVTGVLGGYTTFSALTVEVVHLARMDRPYLAMFYVTVTVGGAVVACILGAALTRRAAATFGSSPRSTA